MQQFKNILNVLHPQWDLSQALQNGISDSKWVLWCCFNFFHGLITVYMWGIVWNIYDCLAALTAWQH